MPQILRGGAVLPAKRNSAAVRAMQLTSVQDSVVASTAPHLLGTLAQVNKDLYRATHTPAVWCAQYIPAHADLDSRTIYTSVPPPPERKSAYQRDPVEPTQSWSLGRCRGEEWILRYQRFDPMIYAEETKQILDAVTKTHFHGLFAVHPNFTREQAWRNILVANRGQANAFMKDRLYRIDHDLPIHIYTRSARCILALAAGTAATTLGTMRCCAAAENATETLGYVAAFAGVIVCFMLSAFQGMTVAAFLLLGNGADVRNALIGPLDYVRLNRWARKIPVFEAAAKQQQRKIRADNETQH